MLKHYLSELVGIAKFVLAVPDSSMHGKGECRKGRKTGHIIISANSGAQLRARIRQLLQHLSGADAAASGASDFDLYRLEAPRPSLELSHKQPLVGVILGSDSDLPVTLPPAHILDRFQILYKLTTGRWSMRGRLWREGSE